MATDSRRPHGEGGQKEDALRKAYDELERRVEERSEALRKSEAFCRKVLETVDEGFIVLDRQYRIISANRAFCNLAKSSRKVVIGKACHLVSHNSSRPCFEAGEDCPVRRTFETGIAQSATHTHMDASGVKKYVEVKSYPVTDETGKVVSAIETVNDVTEKRKLEEQLRQVQKIEAIGRLAGGVAHDFNNMLGVIIGCTDLARRQMDPSNPLSVHLREIRKAAERSADLTRQLLAFARKQAILPKVLDLNETLEGMLKMLRRLIGEDINLAWCPGKGAWRVKMDPSQIDQILANLCVNSRDAIDGVGEITIETRNVRIDRTFRAAHPEAVKGDYLLLAVRDNGGGMDQEVLDKIFEPFFTTKEDGKGTGLGLATVYGIVKQNNGFIYVDSEPEQGTSFKIYLPKFRPRKERIMEHGLLSPIPGGHETILLVEDEPAILETAQSMLEMFGYQVFPASTPHEAVQLAEKNAGKIHLLLTDVVMPEMNGCALANKLLARYPKIKPLFMSGYSDDIIADNGILLGEGVSFLQKPFSSQALAVKVRQVLDGSPLRRPPAGSTVGD